MRSPIGLMSAGLGAAVLLVLTAAHGGDDAPRPQSTEVVMKSLDTNLLLDGRTINARHEFLTYRVEQTRGDWLWLVSDQGTRGWANRRDVVPVDQAVAYFSESIARQPRSAQGYRMRGLAHARVKEYRRAIHDASAAIRLEPGLAQAHVDRCYARLEKNDTRGARADAEKAIRLDPQSPRAYRCRAYVSRVNDQVKQAIADLDAAIRLASIPDRLPPIYRTPSSDWTSKNTTVLWPIVTQRFVSSPGTR